MLSIKVGSEGVCVLLLAPRRGEAAGRPTIANIFCLSACLPTILPSLSPSFFFFSLTLSPPAISLLFFPFSYLGFFSALFSILTSSSPSYFFLSFSHSFPLPSLCFSFSFPFSFFLVFSLLPRVWFSFLCFSQVSSRVNVSFFISFLSPYFVLFLFFRSLTSVCLSVCLFSHLPFSKFTHF